MSYWRRQRVLGIAAGLLLVLAVPATAATTPAIDTGNNIEPDPVEFALKLLDLTLAYAEDFDPNDNATTMKAKTELFVGRVAESFFNLLCMDFKLGLTISWIGVPSISDRKLIVRVLAWGEDEQTGQEGLGVLTIELDPWGSCSTLIERPGPLVQADDPLLDEFEGVIRSAARQFAYSSPAFS